MSCPVNHHVSDKIRGLSIGRQRFSAELVAACQHGSAETKQRDLSPATCAIKTEIVCEEKVGWRSQLKGKKPTLRSKKLRPMQVLLEQGS